METHLVIDTAVGKKRICVRAPGRAEGAVPASLPVIYLNVFVGDGAEIWGRCSELDCPPFALVSIGGIDWERDMTPWPAEPATRREAPYAGEAGAYLDELLFAILPAAEAELAGEGIAPAWRGLAGYSLAGLFALWAAWRTDAFSRVASASGSLWYEGWLGYARTTEPAAWPERAALSLGSREHKTPNRLMRNVRRATDETADLLRAHSVTCTFELNPGNHFQDTDLRMARAIAQLLE